MNEVELISPDPPVWLVGRVKLLVEFKSVREYSKLCSDIQGMSEFLEKIWLLILVVPKKVNLYLAQNFITFDFGIFDIWKDFNRKFDVFSFASWNFLWHDQENSYIRQYVAGYQIPAGLTTNYCSKAEQI